jgi:hypothetical protein
MSPEQVSKAQPHVYQQTFMQTNSVIFNYFSDARHDEDGPNEPRHDASSYEPGNRSLCSSELGTLTQCLIVCMINLYWRSSNFYQMNNMRPEDWARASEQISNMSPTDLQRQAAQAQQQLSGQQQYVLNASKQLKTEGNALHNAGKYKVLL